MMGTSSRLGGGSSSTAGGGLRPPGGGGSSSAGGSGSARGESREVARVHFKALKDFLAAWLDKGEFGRFMSDPRRRRDTAKARYMP